MLVPHLLLTTATLFLSASATVVTHVETAVKTITVHHSSLATARPFGDHSSKHYSHHHRADHRSKNSHSKHSTKGSSGGSSHGHKSSSGGKKDGKRTSTAHKTCEKSTGSLPAKKTSTKHVSHKPASTSSHKPSEQHSKTSDHHSKATASKSKSKTKTETKPKTKTASKPKETKTSTIVAVPSKTPVNLDQTMSKLAQDSLSAHNELRAKYKAKPLTWSIELASAAQSWTDTCIYQHGKGHEIGAGENIAAYTGSDNVLGAISMWSNEASLYNFAAPAYAGDTGHFTQQVWQTTTEIGCAQTLCPTLQIPDKPSWNNGYFYVCEYKKGGNIIGSTIAETAKIFAENVLH
ncbi:hypothetical protein JCM16303_005578 [Sporobolomyces ruberrimus]